MVFQPRGISSIDSVTTAARTLGRHSRERPAMRKAATRACSAALLALLAVGTAGTCAAQADDPEQAARYQACMDLAETAPDEALESAQTWADLGGSDPARHCAAVSLMRLGHYEAAGQELETLAGSLEASYAYLPIPILIPAARSEEHTS